jgi:hypothetical protein
VSNLRSRSERDASVAIGCRASVAANVGENDRGWPVPDGSERPKAVIWKVRSLALYHPKCCLINLAIATLPCTARPRQCGNILDRCGRG